MADLPPIRAVLFDAVGTVLFPDPPVAVAYGEVARRYGSRLSRDTILDRFRRAFRAEEERDRQIHTWRTDEGRECQRWRSIVGTVLDDVSDADATFAELWNHFARPASWRVAEDVPMVLADLKRLRLPWGLASNFDARLTTICRHQPELAECHWVFVSSQIGWRKPSKGFFAAIEQQLDLPAASILLVGDDLHNDFHAAQAAGFSAVWLGGGAKPEISPCIARLKELPTLLRARMS